MRSKVITFVIAGILLFTGYLAFRNNSFIKSANAPTYSPNIPTPTPVETPLPSPLSLHTIGQVTRHVSGFVGQIVRVEGYMLVGLNNNYVIFSDETGGAISAFDLPVTGPGIETLEFKQKYKLEGRFVYGGLNASNHSQYHLELSLPPQSVK